MSILNPTIYKTLCRKPGHKIRQYISIYGESISTKASRPEASGSNLDHREYHMNRR
jgi:hypothetical protein